MIITPPLGWWRIGTNLKKIRGGDWRGKVVGYYSTELTPMGYVVESCYHPGTVQLYPAAALEWWDGESE